MTFVMANLRGKKWVLFSIYRPPSHSQDHFFKNLGKAVDQYSEKHDNYLIFGDFNTAETDQQIRTFMDSYGLNNLIEEPACFRAENPCCVDLILTNRYRSFQHTTTFETGLSDFHKMIVTVLKTTYAKTGPTVINYRDYKNFSEQTFKRELKEELDSNETTDLDYSSFQTCFEKVLDKHAPMKKKYARAHDGPFMNRTLRKATMLRSRLRNRYNKSRTAEH